MMKSQLLKSAIAGFLALAAFGFADAGSAEAQATFQTSGTATPVTKIGQTELVGAVTFAVESGTTRAGTIEFSLPNVRITNDQTSGIQASGSGGLAAAAIASVIPSPGLVIINIPAGGNLGDTVTLSGVRIAAAGQTFNTLDATISASGNFIVVGQNSVRVVSSVEDGMTIDATDNVVTVTNGVIVTTPGAFIISEGWNRSFSSAIGVAGQTAKTQVIFQVTGLPDNVSLTFPATVSAGTGATLTTLSGNPEVVTNAPGMQRVVYEFSAGTTSDVALDMFSLTPAIGFTGVPGTGTAVIQAALGPIGAAVPNSDFPSTAIPRFEELFLPGEAPTPPPLITSRLMVPPVDSQTITISNTNSGAAVVTIRARDDAGALVTGPNFTNEATRTFAAHQTTTLSLQDIFGSGASAAGIFSVEVESANSGIVITSAGSIGGRRFAINPVVENSGTDIPFDRLTSASIPLLTLNNTGTDATVTITLRSSAGANLGTAQRLVPSLGTVRKTLSSLFPAAALPLSGYVIIRSSSPVRSVLVDNPSTRPDASPTLNAVSDSTTFPFFAFGAGWNTILELINASDSDSIRVTLTPVLSNGAALAAPFAQTLQPAQRQDFDFRRIFGTGSLDFTTAGYFTVQLERLGVSNPFAGPAQAFGIVRIGTDSLTSALPLSTNATTQFFVTPASENSRNWTGLSIVNTTSNPTNVTIQAFAANGALLGSTAFAVAAGAARVQLMRELIPQSVNSEDVLLQISSTPGGVKILSFRGTLNLDELIYLQAQTAP